MHTKFTFKAMLGAALLATTLGACGDNGGDDTTTTMPPLTSTDPSTTMGETSLPTTGDETTNTTPSDPSTTTTNTTPPDPDTTDPVTTDPTTTDPTTGGDPGFLFADDPIDAYTQIDRHAAVEAGTAGIKASQGLGFPPTTDIGIRDEYNASNPAEDAAGMWVPEILDSITFFHDALDDDIMGLGLTPATVDETVMQAGPVIIPDTIKYDPTLPTAYPNGRTLQDPVVDITLAAVLLKLGPNQPLSFFADLPLNPPANDVPFQNEFPFLAPPH